MVRPRASSLTGWQCRSVKAKASALRAAIDALGSLGPGVSLQALRALRSLTPWGPWIEPPSTQLLLAASHTWKESSTSTPWASRSTVRMS